jgi:hypothetical protein
MIERPRIGTPHVRGHRHVGGPLEPEPPDGLAAAFTTD